MSPIQNLNLPWLIYALGGGIGHLNRAFSLARTVADSHLVIIISNSPFAVHLRKINTNQNILIYDIPEDLSQTEATPLIVDLLSITPCALIVDALPRGLWGELGLILPKLTSIPRILLLRDLPSEYVVHKNIENFVQSHYDLVIVIGPYEQPSLIKRESHFIETEPWLSLTDQELLGFEQATRILNLTSSEQKRKTIVIISSGKLEEQAFYSCLAKDLAEKMPWVNIRLLSLSHVEPCPSELWISHFPAFECLPAADIVIGGCGYNTFYECIALNIPLVAFPWSRLHDQQRQRGEKANTFNLGRVKIVTDVDQVFLAISDLLSDNHNQDTIHNSRRQYTFKNGLLEGVDLIHKSITEKINEIAYCSMTENIKNLSFHD